MEGALSQELEPELNFLTDYDVARRSVLALPDRKRDKLITLLYQNRGSLSSSKCKLFNELTKAELAQLTARFRASFEMEEEASPDLSGMRS